MADAPRMGELPAVRPPSRPNRGRGRTMVLAALAAAALAGAVAARYALPRPVAQAEVTPGRLELTVTGPGTLDAITAADLATKIAGRLVEVRVERNSRVAPGDVIAEIDASDLREQLAAAMASHEAARNAVAQAEAALEQARISRRKLDDDLARSAALLERGVVNRSEYDARAAAQQEGAAQVAQLGAALEAARAQAASAEASQAYAQAQVDQATLRAPFAGIVTDRWKSPGDFMAAGAPVVRLVDPESLVLTARFDESLIAALAPGLVASLTFTSQPDQPIPATVLRLSRSVDSETREFTADIRPETLPQNWAIGQRGMATVKIGALEDVLWLPVRFLARQDGVLGVWLARDGRARWQPVVAGAQSDGRVEIRSGLVAGDVAVSAARIFPGMRLKLSEDAAR